MTVVEIERDLDHAIAGLMAARRAATHIAASSEQSPLRKVCSVVREFAHWAQQQVPAEVEPAVVPPAVAHVAPHVVHKGKKQ